jgi:glycosyltransferase involved in cell wall biosynthesis
LKKPLILSEHSSYYHTEIYHLPPSQIKKSKNEITQLLNKKALKYILPVSRQLAHIISNDFKVPLEKMVVTPNVANDVFLTAPILKTQNKNEIEVFAAAMWVPPKNPILFFELLRLLKARENALYHQLKINWAGIGSQLEEIVDLVKKDLPDLKIAFLGLLTKEIICKQMSSADFLIHPTDAENLPCIIIESLCVGLPVLSANVNGIVELINETNGKMYTAKNVESFYLHFLEMINTIEQFNREKIAEEARKKYRATAIGKQIMDVYKKVLAN